MVKNFPSKSNDLLHKTVILTRENNFQVLTDIKVPIEENIFQRDVEKQFVYLQAQFPSKLLEKVVMVSFQSGYIFIQTDKPIYTPSSTVLPTIEATLSLSKSYFYVGEDRLTVKILAKYLFGQKVEGQAYVVFGIMDEERKLSIPDSLQRVPIDEGEGSATLTKEMILETFPNINQLVYVTNSDQTPAENVPVEVNPGGFRSQTKANGIAKIPVQVKGDSSTLDITVKTTDPKIEDKQQALKKMTAHAYKPKGNSKNCLHIGLDAAELEIDDQRKVSLIVPTGSTVKNHDFTYMIFSKGQIVRVGREKRQGGSLIVVPLTVTKDMVPSFRIVAYYHFGSDEVVSDSVWVDVKDTCMGTLKLQLKDKNYNQNYKSPNDRVNWQITGDPGAKVGLVVVDKAVHVLNKNRLTQSKIWDVIEKHDTGCTAGSGRDSMGVFYDAGLMFESSTAGGTDIRKMPDCPAAPQRRRRAGDLLQVTSTLSGKYPGHLKKCCVDGMRDNKLGYSCERRATYIEDGQECVQAFLHCCNEAKNSREKFGDAEMVLARSDEDDNYSADSDDIVTRSVFPESWFWDEVEVPQCGSKTCITPKKTMHLKDSITTWQILAISMSDTHGGVQHVQIRSDKPSDWIPDTPAKATIMVFQAIAEYRTQVRKSQDFRLDVELALAERINSMRWSFSQHNVHVTRSDKTDLNKDFNITAKGTGTAALSVLRLYYARPADNVNNCNQFDLTVKIAQDRKASYVGALESYTITLEFFYQGKTDATMSILDVGLLTGFIADERDLTELVLSKDRVIQKFEIDKKLSERGSLIIYLNKVSYKEIERIVFRMHKMNQIGLLQPAGVTFYQYYSPDTRCTKYYHPERQDGTLLRLCQGDVCQCAEVYKVKVERMNLSVHSDVYKMKVLIVLKEGTDAGVEGEERIFMNHPNCREELGLQKDKTYLIMGKFIDVPIIGNSRQYIMGEHTLIEYWPTREESQTPEYRKKYIGLSGLDRDLFKTGCTT
ncbi:Complement C3 [Triplophysa tibetana]|uniref:Complement C3 n=1 Tax=Triplophysa tibetana TaxID=1572043 RepID=A0A5A9PIY4_9TELE|nr:Complement C3 [Triplophysa tibetana]